MFKNKIAVFDLDDTLYISNSHTEILCLYYKTTIFKRIIYKAVARLFPEIDAKFKYWLYKRIPKQVKKNFVLPFNNDVVALLRSKEKEKFFPLIISNAPYELLENAAKRLGVEYISISPYNKATALLERYTFDYLFVCTDNKSDLDLLEIADEAVITCKKKNRSFFESKLKKGRYSFKELN